MRLIDADKVKRAFIGNRYGTKAIEYVIDNVPTVKAIPVEWIKKWFSQFYGEQGLEWNRCKRFMLEDWEKENESNFNR